MDYNQLDSTNQRPSMTPFASRWGLYLGLFLSFTLVLQIYFQKIVAPMGGFFSLLEFGLTIYLLYLGAKNYRDTLPDAPLSYGQAFKFGAFQGLFATIIVAVPFILILYIFKPSYPQELQQKVIDTYNQMGMNEEIIEQSMKYTKFVYSKGFLLFTSMGGTFLTSLIASLVMSAFVQKKVK